jgi:NAD(P)-dependent dehydrogenase (short-subunit alcohol dehydrogenase family)
MPALQKGDIMKLTGKKALITGGNSGIGFAQPNFSLRRARRSPLLVATRRRSMQRSPSLEQTRVATALT